MAASAADPNLWEDDFGESPPPQWEAVENDGRWWWHYAIPDTAPIYFIGDDLGETLEFEWEIVSNPLGVRHYFYYAFNNSAEISFELDGTSGSVVLDVPPGATGFYFGIANDYSDGAYESEIAVLGPAIRQPEPQALVFGAVINIVEKDVLDSFYSLWTGPSTKIPGPNYDYYKAYAMDANDPLAFFLYPRGYDGADVIVTYAGIPAEVTGAGDTLTLSDMYVPALVDYCVARCLAKDSRGAARELAEKYSASFLSRLGVSRRIVQQIGQNATRPPDAEA